MWSKLEENCLVSLQSSNGAFDLQQQTSAGKQRLCFWSRKPHNKKEQKQKCAAGFILQVSLHLRNGECVSHLKQEVIFGSRKILLCNLMKQTTKMWKYLTWDQQASSLVIWRLGITFSFPTMIKYLLKWTNQLFTHRKRDIYIYALN